MANCRLVVAEIHVAVPKFMTGIVGREGTVRVHVTHRT